MCGRFGHKAINCFQRRNFETRNNLASLRWPQYNNRFGPLRSEIECYKCNNFGHIAKDCRMKIPTVRNEEMSNKVLNNARTTTNVELLFKLRITALVNGMLIAFALSI